MPGWDDDSSRLIANLESLLREVRVHAEARGVPSLEMVKGWHRRMLEGLDVPDLAAAGRFRGEQGVQGIVVRVGWCYGTPSRDVSGETHRFLHSLIRALAFLDEAVPKGEPPTVAEGLDAVLTLSALTHAHWIAIHPFVNGNGRTAPTWKSSSVGPSGTAGRGG